MPVRAPHDIEVPGARARSHVDGLEIPTEDESPLVTIEPTDRPTLPRRRADGVGVNNAPPPAAPVADTADPTSAGRSARQLTFARRVTGRDVLRAFMAVVLAPGVASALVVVAGVFLEEDWLVYASVPLAAVVACGALWATLVRRGWSWRDLGFVRASRSLWNLLWEVPLVWIAAMVLTGLLGTLVGLDPSGADSSFADFEDALQLGVGALLVTAVSAAVVVPVLEEIFFRRVLFGWIEQRRGVAMAVIGSAVLFSLAHIAPPVIMLTFFIGLGAAVLVRAHRTLWAPLALHALNNSVVSVAALTVLL